MISAGLISTIVTPLVRANNVDGFPNAHGRQGSIMRNYSGGVAVLALATTVMRPSASAQAPDTIRMRVAWEVAEGRHPTADSLGELSGIAVDRSGNVYVSDFDAAKIWVFDVSGRSVSGIGRKGQGPGEFQAPTGVAVAPDGRLYVRDVVRVSRFGADPHTGRLTRYESVFPGPTMADWRSTLATRFDSAGRLYYPAFGARHPARSGFFVRFDKAGTVVDSILVPAFPGAPASTAFVMVSERSGRMLRGLHHAPFAPVPTWDITTRGTLLIGDGRDYTLRETDATGREVRAYRRQVAAERIPPRERQDSAAALRARLDSITVPLDQVQGMPPDVRAGRVPEVFPPYMTAYAGADGRVWVRRWIAGSRQSVFDVFDSDGRLRAVVVLPNEIAIRPTPVLSLAGGAAIGIDRETGANTVVRFLPPTKP